MLSFNILILTKRYSFYGRLFGSCLGKHDYDRTISRKYWNQWFILMIKPVVKILYEICRWHTLAKEDNKNYMFDNFNSFHKNSKIALAHLGENNVSFFNISIDKAGTDLNYTPTHTEQYTNFNCSLPWVPCSCWQRNQFNRVRNFNLKLMILNFLCQGMAITYSPVPNNRVGRGLNKSGFRQIT